MRYVCAECGESVQHSRATGGLGTWTCRKHPERFVTVLKDISGGKEGSSRNYIAVPVQVRRHTKVRAIK